jgi:hypothetical protein
VEPRTGTVPEGGSVAVAVTWRPDLSKGPDAEELTMEVVGGHTDCTLNCVGESFRTKVSVKEKIVEFGAVSVGLQREASLSVRNAAGGASGCDAVFVVDPLPDGIKVRPMSGRITPGSTQDLMVTMLSPGPVNIRDSVVLSFRGGASAKVPVTGKALYVFIRVFPLAHP